jgi:hypothetical protein
MHSFMSALLVVMLALHPHACKVWALGVGDHRTLQSPGVQKYASPLRLKGGCFTWCSKSLSQRVRASVENLAGSVGKNSIEKGSKLAGKWRKVKEVGQEEAMLQVPSWCLDCISYIPVNESSDASRLATAWTHGHLQKSSRPVEVKRPCLAEWQD